MRVHVCDLVHISLAVFLGTDIFIAFTNGVFLKIQFLMLTVDRYSVDFYVLTLYPVIFVFVLCVFTHLRITIGLFLPFKPFLFLLLDL